MKKADITASLEKITQLCFELLLTHIDLWCCKQKVIFLPQGFSNQVQLHSLGYGVGHTQNGFVVFFVVDCVLLLKLMRSTDMLLAQYCLRRELP